MGGIAPLVVAAIVPVAIGCAFPRPVDRLVAPFALMFAAAVMLALLDGVVTGLVAVLSGVVTLWFVDAPPAFSFDLTRPRDAVILGAVGLVGVGAVFGVAIVNRYDRRVVERSRQIAVALVKQTLLPSRVPAVEGVRVGWSYRPSGAAGMPVGGDFLLFVPLGPKALGVGVGDATGHGLDAAAAMGGYRYALASAAHDRCSPHQAIERLKAFVDVYSDETFASCVYGIVDRHAGSFTFTSAGHPPPVLVRGGETIVCDSPHGPLITGSEVAVRPYTQSVVELREGDLLACYTDGLVERRGEALSDGIGRLGDRLRAVASDDLFGEADRIVAELVGSTAADDVTLLLVRFGESDASSSEIR